jgi:hypothetical protein
LKFHPLRKIGTKSVKDVGGKLADVAKIARKEF